MGFSQEMLCLVNDSLVWMYYVYEQFMVNWSSCILGWWSNDMECSADRTVHCYCVCQHICQMTQDAHFPQRFLSIII